MNNIFLFSDANITTLFYICKFWNTKLRMCVNAKKGR